MRLCVAQTKPCKGDIAANIGRHITLINLAVSQGANAVFFPELSITGYEPTLAPNLAMEPNDARLAIFQQTSDRNQIVIGVGVPTKQEAGICISLVIFQPLQERRLYAKQYLHPDEEPFFISGANFPALIIQDQPIALAICYELFIAEHTANACAGGAAIYVASVAKSVAGIEKALARLADNAIDHSITVLMANCIGEADGEECAGQSAVWNDKGVLLGQMDAVSEGLLLLDTTTQTVLQQTI